MKSALLIFILSVSMVAVAESVEIGLPTDAISLMPLAGSVSRVTATQEGTRVELTFVAKNCVDQVTPVVYNQNGPLVVVSVWNVSRKLSYWAPCADFPVYRPILLFKALHPPFRIEFMGTQESVFVDGTNLGGRD